jgi:hypothetical protein
MKRRRPKTRKVAKQASTRKQRGNPAQRTVGWGRGASAYRPGLFTKQYFVEHGEAPAADIYYALSQELKRLNAERVAIGEEPLRRPNYSSFARYFHWFLILGLIERTDLQEPSVYGFLRNRVFYRLTDKGMSEEAGWSDPARAAHPEFG